MDSTRGKLDLQQELLFLANMAARFAVTLRQQERVARAASPTASKGNTRELYTGSRKPPPTKPRFGTGGRIAGGEHRIATGPESAYSLSILMVILSCLTHYRICRGQSGKTAKGRHLYFAIEGLMIRNRVKIGDCRSTSAALGVRRRAT